MITLTICRNGYYNPLLKIGNNSFSKNQIYFQISSLMALTPLTLL